MKLPSLSGVSVRTEPHASVRDVRRFVRSHWKRYREVDEPMLLSNDEAKGFAEWLVNLEPKETKT